MQKALIDYCSHNPGLEPQDIFKYLNQSCFGPEHLVTDSAGVLVGIREEAGAAAADRISGVEDLSGDFCRVHFSVLSEGLSPETLCRLFCLSAGHRPEGRARLEEALALLPALAEAKQLPFTQEALAEALATWREQGFPAVHHSETYRNTCHPAYRVIKKELAALLPLLCRLDRLQQERGKVILAIDGPCTSGKTTLAGILKEIYPEASVFHMDDYFLRPEQRSAERRSTPGENVDHERFREEVLLPLSQGREIRWHAFDCAGLSLGPEQVTGPTALTLVEGSYSFHPELIGFYDLKLFLEISPELQRQRILERETPEQAERFFEMWVPMENRYFEGLHVREKADMVWRVN